MSTTQAVAVAPGVGSGAGLAVVPGVPIAAVLRVVGTPGVVLHAAARPVAPAALRQVVLRGAVQPGVPQVAQPEGPQVTQPQLATRVLLRLGDVRQPVRQYGPGGRATAALGRTSTECGTHAQTS